MDKIIQKTKKEVNKVQKDLKNMMKQDKVHDKIIENAKKKNKSKMKKC